MANTKRLVKMTNQGAAILKTTLVAGSIIATLLGANLVAHRDQAATLTPLFTSDHVADVKGQLPQSLAAVPNLPAASDLNGVAVDKLLNQPLAPIPALSLPVARSRSSR